MQNTQQNSFTSRDHFFMKHALRLARKSLRAGEVPVGAIVVSPDGIIIGRGFNKIETDGTQLAHAEITALKKAAKKRGGWRLDECTLYVTLEPCMMCLGAALLSRIGTIIYGAPSHLFGIQSLQTSLPPVYQAHTRIRQGLHQQECGDMLKHFFHTIRSTQEAARERTTIIHTTDERESSQTQSSSTDTTQ
jgi:tRNA(adenine34) deaminase